ncbi:MAG: hypothetical protein JJP05_07565 [cyanobacterium endosymbiont of Rhopalodia gibba]
MDTEIGINSKKLPDLFERFRRADKSRARHAGGTGIGLAIIRQRKYLYLLSFNCLDY